MLQLYKQIETNHLTFVKKIKSHLTHSETSGLFELVSISSYNQSDIQQAVLTNSSNVDIQKSENLLQDFEGYQDVFDI